MDVRTKLALAFVAVSLLSMLALGTFAYHVAFDLLREVSERQLDAMAESRRDDLVRLVDGWKARVELVRSRTRLRSRVAAYRVSRDPSDLAEIERILEDAVRAERSLSRVTLFLLDGEPIATVGDRRFRRAPEAPDERELRRVHLAGTHLVGSDPLAKAGDVADDEGGGPPRDVPGVFVRIVAPLERDDDRIGSLEAILSGSELASVTRDYTGLGATGETLLFTSGPDGEVRMLGPLRHGATGPTRGTDFERDLDSILSGRDDPLRGDIRDYRGVEVWRAARQIDEVGWGLVVKIDHAEEVARARQLRDEMLDVGLALGALAILGGTLLGFRLGTPLRQLTEIVERVRAGEHELRASASGRDEIGFLARSLNEFLDERSRGS